MKAENWQIIRFDEVESTNDEALKYSQSTNEANCVITAKRQTKGRGRRGRSWVSLDGNLFFSILLKFEVRNLGALAVISSLSLLQCIKFLKPEADVLLKWPNDVLLNEAKVSGILAEKAAGDYMIVGIGVNIKQSPPDDNMLYPTISLKDAGIIVSADDFLSLYIKMFGDNIDLYYENGFAILQRQWSDNAKGIGKEITIRQEGNVRKGIFKGIGAQADLLLENDGVISKILVGDVFYEGWENDGV